MAAKKPILVLDGDSAWLKRMETELGEKWEVFIATTPKEAEAILKKHSKIEVAIVGLDRESVPDTKATLSFLGEHMEVVVEVVSKDVSWAEHAFNTYRNVAFYSDQRNIQDILGQVSRIDPDEHKKRFM